MLKEESFSLVQCSNLLFSSYIFNGFKLNKFIETFITQMLNQLYIFSMEINQDIFHSSKDTKQAAIPILLGTCSQNDFSKVIDIERLLEQPEYYLLLLPQEIKFNEFVIVRQFKDNQQFLYHMYFQPTQKHLLSAKKQNNSIGCNYIFSKNKTPRKDDGYIGKLRGNFMNTQFNLYDSGNNPNKNIEPFRNHLGYIELKNSLFSNSSNISVYLPRPQDINNQAYQMDSQLKNNEKYYYPIKVPQYKTKTNALSNLYKTNTSKVQLLKNMKFNLKLLNQVEPMFSINIQESAKTSSALQTGLKKNCLITGKRTQRTYFLYASSPLCILQSFAYFLSIIQSSNSYI